MSSACHRPAPGVDAVPPSWSNGPMRMFWWTLAVLALLAVPAGAGEDWALWRNGPLGVEFQRPASWDAPVIHCGNTFMGLKHPLGGDYEPDDPDYRLEDFARTDEAGRWCVATVYVHPNADGPQGRKLFNCARADDVPAGALPEGVTEWVHRYHPMRAWVVMDGRRRLTLSVGEHSGDDLRVLRDVASRMRLLVPEVQNDPERDGWRTWRTDEFEMAYPADWERVLPTRNEADPRRVWSEIWTCEDDVLGGHANVMSSEREPLVMRLEDGARPDLFGSDHTTDPAGRWIENRERTMAAFQQLRRREWEATRFVNDAGQEGVRERRGANGVSFTEYVFFGTDRVYRLEFGPFESRERGEAFARADEVARRFRLLTDAPAGPEPASRR